MVDKRIIERNFSRNSSCYDGHSAVQNKCAAGLARILEDGRYRSILEIGCGTGAYTGLLAGMFPEAEISAVDISRSMLEKVSARPGMERVRFVEGDAESAPVGSGYDLITSNAVFQWFEDIRGSLADFHGKMEKNGTLCFSIYGPGTFRELQEVFGLVLGERKKWLSSSGFVSREKIYKSVSAHFDIVYFDERDYRVSFDSLLGLLRDIKLSGTRGEGLGGVFLGKNMLTDLEKTYYSRFGRIISSHNVIFCKALKR